jgi:hypothetical protein
VSEHFPMSILRLPTHRQVAFPLPFISLHTAAGWSAVPLGEVAEHFLKRALVDHRIAMPGMIVTRRYCSRGRSTCSQIVSAYYLA